MELQTKPPESPFNRVGDSVQGLFVSYEKKPGNFNKAFGLLTLKTRDGIVKINCPSFLTQLCDDNLSALPGCVLTIWLVDLKDTGKGNPMKVFKMDATKKGQPLPSLDAPVEQPEDGDDAEEPPF